MLANAMMSLNTCGISTKNREKVFLLAILVCVCVALEYVGVEMFVLSEELGTLDTSSGQQGESNFS